MCDGDGQVVLLGGEKTVTCPICNGKGIQQTGVSKVSIATERDRVEITKLDGLFAPVWEGTVEKWRKWGWQVKVYRLNDLYSMVVSRDNFNTSFYSPNYSSPNSAISDCNKFIEDHPAIPRKIPLARKVSVFPNGMIATFDCDGNQIPELQGRDTPALRNLIEANSSDETEWTHDSISVASGRIPPHSALAEQHGGNHYKKMKIQVVEFCHANNIPFLEGTSIKHLCRHRDKNKAEDLLKAIHYAQIALELEYGVKTKFERIDSAPSG